MRVFALHLNKLITVLFCNLSNMLFMLFFQLGNLKTKAVFNCAGKNTGPDTALYFYKTFSESSRKHLGVAQCNSFNHIKWLVYLVTNPNVGVKGPNKTMVLGGGGSCFSNTDLGEGKNSSSYAGTVYTYFYSF